MGEWFNTPTNPRPCEHARCRRRVFDARHIKQRGTPVDLVLDAEPKPWAEGARYKVMLTGQPVTTVIKLTATQIHKAFGRNTLLYVKHDEVCEAEQHKTTAKKKDGHA